MSGWTVSRIRVIVILFSAAKQMLRYYFQEGYERFLSHSFQFISHYDVMSAMLFKLLAAFLNNHVYKKTAIYNTNETVLKF